MNKTVVFGANEVKNFKSLSDFFRVLAATSTLTVRFYYQGRQISEAPAIEFGYAEEFVSGPFDEIQIENGANAQTVQFVTRLGSRVSYDKSPVGNVFVTNTGGAFAQNQKTVTNASAQLLAANSVRRYLLIQNNDASGDVYITLDGTEATIAKGIKIAPGGSYECQGYVPTGEIRAIGSLSSNANIVAVEG